MDYNEDVPWLPPGWRATKDNEIIKPGDKCRADDDRDWLLITQDQCLGTTGAYSRSKWPHHYFITPDPLYRPYRPIFQQRILDKKVLDDMVDAWPKGFKPMNEYDFALAFLRDENAEIDIELVRY